MEWGQKSSTGLRTGWSLRPAFVVPKGVTGGVRQECGEIKDEVDEEGVNPVKHGSKMGRGDRRGQKGICTRKMEIVLV